MQQGGVSWRRVIAHRPTAVAEPAGIQPPIRHGDNDRPVEPRIFLRLTGSIESDERRAAPASLTDQTCQTCPPTCRIDQPVRAKLPTIVEPDTPAHRATLEPDHIRMLKMSTVRCRRCAQGSIERLSIESETLTVRIIECIIGNHHLVVPSHERTADRPARERVAG
jgi:hypothetical protein